jgi:hypothetical protein
VGTAVTGLESAWETYVLLYQLLQGWAAAYVPEAASRKVARFAIARLFQLACIAWETAEGVYAEAGDLALNLMMREAWNAGEITLGSPQGNIPVPDRAFLDALARLYANVYQLAYFGDWTIAEREVIAMAIRQHHPVMHDPLFLEMHLAGSADPLPALRRAVQSCDEHTCDDHMVCQAASEIWADEARRQDLWVKYRRT